MKTTKTLLLPALGLFAITSLLGVAVFSAPGTLDAAERKLGVLLVPGPGADKARILAVKPVFKRQLKLLDGVSYRDASVPMSRARQAELNTLVNTAMMALNTKDFSGARAVLSALEDQMKQSPASSDKVFLARFYKAYGAALVGNGLRDIASLVSTRGATQSEIHIFQVRLELLVQQPHLREQLCPEQRRCKGRKPECPRRRPGRSVQPFFSAPPGAASAAHSVKGRVDDLG